MPKRETKAKATFRLKQHAKYAVQRYWNDRLNEGVALRGIDLRKPDGELYFTPEVDYKGSPPWPSLVSLDAFYADFLMSEHGVLMERIRFANFFRAASASGRGISKNKSPLDEHGRRKWHRHCVFYDIQRLCPPAPRGATGSTSERV